VLNWNNATDTINCLISLKKLDYPCYDVVVVDNASQDDSVALIRQHDPEIHILQTGHNLGYAGGNNVGIRYALEHGAEYICILNNDTLVAPGFLSPLLESFKHESIGVATPLIVEMARPERVWALGATVDKATGDVTQNYKGQPSSVTANTIPFEVDAAAGTAMLIKREVFEQAGLLDEDFYLYYEETEWSMRVRKAGYGIIAVPQAVILHKVSATLGQTSPVVDYYMLRNHLLFVKLHWSSLARWRLWGRIIARNLLTIGAYTIKPHGGNRLLHRNARLLALWDALLGRWGEMYSDVASLLLGEVDA